jgi:hypothetical protein
MRGKVDNEIEEDFSVLSKSESQQELVHNDAKLAYSIPELESVRDGASVMKMLEKMDLGS